MTYPKRLIEVDLPIARISAHARREKSIRHGHISTLHIWWARRPLAACRAVICAALWPDPVDPLCPPAFREAAITALQSFALRVFPPRLTAERHQLQETLSLESRGRWEAISAGTLTLNAHQPADMLILRLALLDFIADFANWDNSTVPAYLETSRALTQAAHEALGGVPGTRPLVVDPFCGGGSIPVEALRVGADAFASDLNPIPVLLNKVVLEYIPKYGKRLAEEVRKWGEWIKREAERELAEFYPKDPDGATPIAYLWARTIRCEGPACGAEVPLIRSLWLAKKSNRSVALQLEPNPPEKRVDFRIIVKQHHGWVDQSHLKSESSNLKSQISNPKFDGTVKRGSATCPCCGYTTPVARVREQLKAQFGGADSATLFAVVTMTPGQLGRTYRAPSEADFSTIERAKCELERRIREHVGEPSLVPTEPTPIGGGKGAGRAFSQRNYGMDEFRNLFTSRQLLSLTSIVALIRKASVEARRNDVELGSAVEASLSLCLGRVADLANSLCGWTLDTECAKHLFARQAISMVWNFAEGVCISNSAGSWGVVVDRFDEILESIPKELHIGQSNQADASEQPLPDDIASAVVTDPPYYDAVPYSDLSDFFYVWFRRTMPAWEPNSEALTPKGEECIVDDAKGKDRSYFESKMETCLSDSRRVLSPSGIATVVFAHKSTSGWEALLQSMCEAGWTVTASWPIDTEMGSRLRARDSAALASSVHLVCRPREDASGAETDSVGEWRDVLEELPRRIHEWMPRLASEGVVGADAIFACLGPALEIFSRYRRVEKANGETATLREYLEFVWAAVSTEALVLIFKDADAAGLEPDARLTAMWLWTLGGGGDGTKASASDEDSEEDASDDDASQKPGKQTGGFTLEYDAARKIAQGLGVHLEQCQSLVEVKGDKARLLPVSERTAYLFGKSSQAATSGESRKKVKQQTLFQELGEAEAAESGWMDPKGPPHGRTVLDRVHQAMILFAANRGELLKRFLVEDGVGKDARFWKLADNLNKLYPSGTDERRWIEGVLARKKGLGQ
ncbi:MAG: DUF1156 domain-containing protein [Pirellulales bacterium]